MIVPAIDENIALALDHLARSQVIAVPTETVYGLAGDATSSAAVETIYHIKGRPSNNPLIAHVNHPDMAADFVIIDPLSQLLMGAFWPGPLTLVLPLKSNTKISPLARAGLSTLAIRCPSSIFASIIAQFGRPLVAPSANRSGRISPTCAQAVATELGNHVGLIFDGGTCSVGLESTILKVEGQDIFLLRPGGLPRQTIEELIDKPLLSSHPNRAIEAPGMLKSHYAPRAKVQLNTQQVKAGDNLLAFGPNRIAGANLAHYLLNLSPTGDLAEAAKNLFAHLRQLDEKRERETAAIAVEPIPIEGLGEAINDRLRRAAAPR